MTAAEIIRPPPNRNAWQWADDNRVLPIGSAEPGKWRTDRVPYVKAIYEAASDPNVDEIVVPMGAQMSKTETILNIIGHRMDDGPHMPAMYVGPTEKLVRSMSNDRFKKLMDTTPSLQAKLEKGHRDKVTEKFIAGVRFGFAWAGSATELASHPVGIGCIDERDRMESSSGGEGDPVELVRARLETYAGSKLIVVSTPTIEGASPIWALFEEGTMGKWAWPCPDCGEFFIPELKLLKWPDKATPQMAQANARVVCPHCGVELQNHQKGDMNAGGKYIYHVLDDNGKHIAVDEKPENRTASFWVSGLCSPWRPFGGLARRLVAAYRSGEPDKIQAVINTGGGEVWRTKGDAPDWEAVASLRGHYKPLEIAPDIQLITAGVDVQKRGLYYTVRAWRFNVGSDLLASGFIPGETEYDDVWILLGRLLQPGYLPDNRMIDRMFVDSGYRPGDKLRRPEHQVYKFARLYPGTAFATKGHDSLDRQYKMTHVDMSIGGKVIKNAVKLWHINTDAMKRQVHARLQWPQGEPGAWTLNQETDDDYCQQVVAEALVTTPAGKFVWQVNNRNNHYLDCEVGALAAALTLQVHTLKDIMYTTPNAAPATPAPGFINRPPSGGFIRRR